MTFPFFGETVGPFTNDLYLSSNGYMTLGDKRGTTQQDPALDDDVPPYMVSIMPCDHSFMFLIQVFLRVSSRRL